MILANGFNPNSSIFSFDIRIKAEAPSFNVDALAAVTVPFSFWKTVPNVGILSNLTALYSSSSEKTIGSPFL
ncbi:hypothetical protein D3C86_1283450 [compost metagenome]